MLDHFIAADCRVLPANRKGVSSAGGGQRFKPGERQQARGTDVPRIRNDERAVAFVQRAEGASFLGLRWISFGFCAHAGPLNVEGMPNVPSTTSTKFLSSRSMIRFVCAMLKLSTASGSDFKRALYFS